MTDQTTSIDIDAQIDRATQWGDAMAMARMSGPPEDNLILLEIENMYYAMAASLKAMKTAREILDQGYQCPCSADTRLYDEQAVNAAHRVLSGGPMPRNTNTGEGDAN